MNYFPFLLSIPHGGTVIPPQIATKTIISPHDLHDDSDAYTREIYGLEESVAAVVKMDVARAFVDVNRAPDDLPPHNPDGVVKSMTCLQRPIFGEALTPDETSMLLDKYYHPYHMSVQHALSDQRIKFAFDCHSMLAVGPPIGPDAGRERPLICLGNRNGQTCDNAQLAMLADCFRNVYSLDAADVQLNKPFSGGYITRRYGLGFAHDQSSVPWIQIEMNRSLYLAQPHFDHASLEMDAQHLAHLNSLFKAVLLRFADLLVGA